MYDRSTLSREQELAVREIINGCRAGRERLPASDKIHQAALALERDWVNYLERETGAAEARPNVIRFPQPPDGAQ